MPRKDGIVRIQLIGDKALAKQIKGAARALPDETKKIGLDIAEMIAAFTRRKIPTGPARNGHVKHTVQGKIRRGLPVVDGGDLAHPYYGWLEFGGRVGIDRSVFREKIPDGRYIVPTTVERRAQIDEMMADGLETMMRRYGIEVRNA